MTKASNLDINSRLSIASAILINIIGPSVFIVQPGFVQGMVEILQFTEQQAGYVAATEMWGVATTAVILTFFTSRINWRRLITISAVLMVAGNLGSLGFSEPTGFAISRLLVGIGAGTMISLGFTILGLTRDTDRNFGIMVMSVNLYGALVMIMMPTIYSVIGMHGLLIFFTLFASLAFLCVGNLPASADAHIHIEADSITAPAHFRAMAAASVFMFFIGVGSIWTYLFLIGTNGGGTEQQVANAITLSQFMAAAGGLTAALIAARLGRIKPLTLGLIGCAIPQFFLFGSVGLVVYTVAICVFNFMYNMVHPYLYAALSSIDRTARIIKFAVAGQMLGVAIGPTIAASVVTPGNFTNVIYVTVVFFALALILIIPPLINHNLALSKVKEAAAIS